jgi:hypothetical protein
VLCTIRMDGIQGSMFRGETEGVLDSAFDLI